MTTMTVYREIVPGASRDRRRSFVNILDVFAPTAVSFTVHID